MIYGEMYCICGCFEYPLIETKRIVSFVDNLINRKESQVKCFCYNIENSSFKCADALNDSYGEITFDDLSTLLSADKSLISLEFELNRHISTYIYVTLLDEKYFEMMVGLSLEQLEMSRNALEIISNVIHMFYETFQPIYGCCGVEKNCEPLNEAFNMKNIKDIFHDCGYINKMYLSSFPNLCQETVNVEYSIQHIKGGAVLMNRCGLILNQSGDFILHFSDPPLKGDNCK